MLTHGDLTLQIGTTLGDYAEFVGNNFGANAFHVRVTIAPAASPSGPPPQPLNLPSGGRSPTSPTLSPPLLSSATPRTPFTSDTTSFLILVLLEDGRSLQPVVWGSMQIRQLCQQVGAFAHVSHDTVFLQYAGSVLDPERRIHDPPAIRTGAHVYAFFSIARALHFVVHLMQGGSPPPPPPPSAPAPSGLGNLPGPAIQTPLASVSSTLTGPTMHLGTTSSSTTDKLRSTFKCPKFLGEVRGWKAWNQGFVRFLSINKLDHVIEEGFLTRTMTLDLQADNKLVYYIIEDAVTGSTVASKYV
jgi:hypothetical protein